MLKAISITQWLLIIAISKLTFFPSERVAALGNFEVETRVHVLWCPDGEQLAPNGARNTFGELSDEVPQRVFINMEKGIIAINGRKYFHRNFTSGDAVLLLGITNAS